jgi:thioredoxin 1
MVPSAFEGSDRGLESEWNERQAMAPYLLGGSRGAAAVRIDQFATGAVNALAGSGRAEVGRRRGRRRQRRRLDAGRPRSYSFEKFQFEGKPMATVKVTDASFEADVLKSDLPVVVDFWAEWCGPCRTIAPALEEIAGELKDKIKVVKLNVDENPNVAGKLGIRSIPTLIVFKEGKAASQKVGAAPKGELLRWINGAI